MSNHEPSLAAPSSISIIIPTLNEASRIAALLQHLKSITASRPAEVIVVDGGSRDGTVEIVRQNNDIRLVELERPGRGFQMNAGARLSCSHILLFLHADVKIPAEALQVIETALEDERVVGGCFQLTFPPDAPCSLRIIAWGINLRTRLFHTATGDQGLFLRRRTFDRIGGYLNIPLMEDVELFQAMKRRGRVRILNSRIEISPRRWLRHGVWRTMFLMYALRAGYWLGISPETLKRFFIDVR